MNEVERRVKRAINMFILNFNKHEKNIKFSFQPKRYLVFKKVTIKELTITRKILSK